MGVILCKLSERNGEIFSGSDLQQAVEGDASPVFDTFLDGDPVDYATFDEVFERPSQVLRADAGHGGAEAAGVVEGDDFFAQRRELPGETIDEVNLRSDGKHGSGRGVFDDLDEAFRGAESVGLLADLPAALGMHDDLDAGVFGADCIYVAGKE